jgi:hypothetical protein
MGKLKVKPFLCIRIVARVGIVNTEAGKITVSSDVIQCSLTDVSEKCAASIFRAGKHMLDYKASQEEINLHNNSSDNLKSSRVGHRENFYTV